MPSSLDRGIVVIDGSPPAEAPAGDDVAKGVRSYPCRRHYESHEGNFHYVTWINDDPRDPRCGSSLDMLHPDNASSVEIGAMTVEQGGMPQCFVSLDVEAESIKGHLHLQHVCAAVCT